MIFKKKWAGRFLNRYYSRSRSASSKDAVRSFSYPVQRHRLKNGNRYLVLVVGNRTGCRANDSIPLQHSYCKGQRHTF